MNNDEFAKQVQPKTTDQGYGCGDCYHSDDAHWGSGSGVSTGSGRMDRSGFGTGYCLCEDNGTGFGRGAGNGYGSSYCTGGNRV